MAHSGPPPRPRSAAPDPADLIHAMATNREAHYRALPTFPRFGRGWLTRLAHTTDLALSMTHTPLIPANAGTQAGGW
jgi:lysozyme family protein